MPKGGGKSAGRLGHRPDPFRCRRFPVKRAFTPGRTIRSRLLRLALACAMPPLLLAAVLLYLGYLDEAERGRAQTLETARALRLAIDRELDGRIRTLEVLALSRPLRQGDMAEFRRDALEMVERQPPGSNLILSVRSGQELVNTLLPEGSPLPKRRDLLAVEKVFATGRPVISNLVYGAVSRLPSIGLSVPVMRDGQVVYDLTLGMRASFLTDLLNRQRVPEGWTVAVIDGAQTIVARNRAPEDYVGRTITGDLASLVTAGQEGSGTATNQEGQRLVTTFSRSEVSEWAVVIGVPEAVLAADLTRSLLVTAGGGAFLLLLAALGARRFAERIAGPVRALADAARLMSEGRPAELPESGLKEADAVAAALAAADRARRDSEERLRLAQRAGGIGTFELNHPAPGLLSVSEEFCRLWGMPVRPIVPLAECAEIVHPDDRRHVATLNGRTTAEYMEYRIVRPDTGEERWLARRGEFIATGDGGPPRLVGVCYDITDRKRVELALHDLNATLEARVADRTRERNSLWDRSQDLLLVARFDGTIVAANPAWETLLGCSEAEIAGRPFLDLVHPEDVQATLAEVGRLAEGHTTLRFENRYRHRDGSYHWISWTAVPDALHIHGVGRDVTEEKQRDAALRAAEEQLRQAQKLEAVGQLTGGVAHDFNNLLQALSGCLRLIAQRTREPAVQPLIDAGEQAVERGAKLVRQLMAFARREGLRPEPIDVRDRVLAMSGLLERALRADIDLDLRFAPGLWPIEADPTQFELALINLAVNARDAMPSGGRLVVEAENVSLGADAAGGLAGDFVRVAVADTGAGMPAEVAARAFEPFFTTKDVGKGSGLGLAQVYGFARSAGGTARIESAEGRGTTVVLLLRRTATRPAAAEPAGEAPAAGAAHGAGRILLVEDDPIVASTVAAALEDAGWETVRVGTADEALPRLAGGQPFDVLLSDIVMPGTLSGIDLAAEARRLRPGLPVVLSTGYGEQVADGLGLELLPKPYRIAELLAALDRARRAAPVVPAL